MKSAIGFYENLLGQKVAERNDIYSVFNINDLGMDYLLMIR